MPKLGPENFTLNEARKRRTSERHRVRCKRELGGGLLLGERFLQALEEFAFVIVHEDAGSVFEVLHKSL